MSLSSYIFVGAGGFLGAVTRLGILQGLAPLFKSFPAGTIICNIGGSLLAGIIVSLANQTASFNPTLKLLFLTGFCGSFTTMSAFVFDTHHLWRQGQTISAFFYAAFTISASFLFFLTGFWAVKVLFSSAN